MGDHYRERWERRQAKWQARQAKWEARAARHEAYRVGYEARRAARMARLANLKSGTAGARVMRPPPQSARIVFGLLGGLFILLGLALGGATSGLRGPGQSFCVPGAGCRAADTLAALDAQSIALRSPVPAVEVWPGYPPSSRDTGRATRAGERGQRLRRLRKRHPRLHGPPNSRSPRRANPIWIRRIIASGRQGIGVVCKASSATAGPAPSPI